MGDPENGVKRVSSLMMWGAGLVIASAVITFFTPVFRNVGGYVISGLLCPVGIAMMIYALSSGWRQARGNDAKRPIERAQNVYIVAKIMTDENGDNVLDALAFSPDELDYYVQIELAPGRTREFETSSEVFSQVGEGLRGDIVYQGKWLSQFVFNPPPQAPSPVDPFVNRPGS